MPFTDQLSREGNTAICPMVLVLCCGVGLIPRPTEEMCHVCFLVVPGFG